MNYFASQISNRLTCNDPSLTEVSIQQFPLTTISSDEIASVVKSLQHNTVVKSIDISIPSIPHDWNDTDITAIESNETFPCSTRDDSYEYLFEMLSTNTVIDSLTIRDIKSDDAWIALSSGMKLNMSIREMTLGNTSNVWNLELSMTACQSLKSILLHENNLQCLRLKSFSISNIESVKEVCYGFQHCRSLRELVFHSMECDRFSMIVSAIAQSKSPLQKLSFIDCHLDFDDEEPEQTAANHPFIMMLSDASACSLIEVRFNECMITCDNINALCKGIAHNSTIELLDLSGCDLLSDVCYPLSDMLRTNKSLIHLDLEENILGDIGVKLLAAALETNSTLQLLDLKANHVSESGCEHIANTLKAGRCQLRSLTLSNNPINDTGASFLNEALRENNNLQSLDIHACMIGDNGLGVLCQGLSSNTSLKEINLSNNWCKRGHHVADMLLSNTVLESIDISSCHISDETLEQLLKSLKLGLNKSLKVLYISFNAFANRGAKAIAEMLMGTNKLEVLSAQYNAFDSDGLRLIATALESHYYLNSFYFWNGQVSTTCDVAMIDKLDHYLNLNRAGRRAMVEHEMGAAIWTDIMKRSDSMYGPTAVFNLLREVPKLLATIER